ncbi:hypothetical protein CEY09_30300 [Achromobacter marplatensis]|uniref:Transposase n=1 Tax=Achromobacter marplatensis TaxID=470868 RepID=A0ABX9FW98_9BURK|nr:hypothetical protein CEY09_30300 [Achromobacter marplatensis]RBP11258.1 hypothetical protein DFP87_12319 [Achromobacter marplatensis]CAB3712427.1 hypothetical protein LMG26219_06004 [Achromobacter marplatensis]
MQTNISYPEYLPAPLWAPNQYAVVSPNQRTNMESGRARQRRKFSSVPVMRSATWVMTSAQARLFELWFRSVLKDGTEWFNVDLRHPVGYVALVCRISGVFAGPTAWGADRWQYSATLEVWERPLLSDEWLLLPDYVANPEIFDLAMNREWPQA